MTGPLGPGAPPPPPPPPPPPGGSSGGGAGGGKGAGSGTDRHREVAGRFALGAGRERPPFQPRTVSCPQCGGSLTVKNEASRLVVCDFCGSHLDFGAEELTVLGKGAEQDWAFPLGLGDSYRHGGARYEVIARLALIEDGDRSELTRQYLLYHPRLGTLWLSEYKGHWDLGQSTHVMPRANPFLLSTGGILETWDGRRWVMIEQGVYQLAYVDGALPWIARIGDPLSYAELSAENRSGELYEVESQAVAGGGSEMEFGRGRRLSPQEVARATGRGDIPGPRGPLEDVAVTRASYRWMLAAALLALVINLVLLGVALSRGEMVLDQTFYTDELTGETLSSPFRVGDGEEVLRVKLHVPSLDNAWMSANVAVVNGEDQVIHVLEEDLEYYHGSEGGESWSEGSRSQSRLFRVPEPGVYRVLVNAASARGNATRALTPLHPLRIEVSAGARPYGWLIFTGILSFAALLIVGLKYHAWKQGSTLSEMFESD